MTLIYSSEVSANLPNYKSQTSKKIFNKLSVICTNTGCSIGPTPFIRCSLKLYCRYEYTNPCMINCIWGLKTTMTSGESTCLISFATAPLTCSERGGSEKFKMKIYGSSGIRTHTTPVNDRKVTAP